MKRLIPALVLGCLLFGGCFPVELDVHDGKLLISRQEGWFIFDPATSKVARIRAANGATPAFARFSPDGKQVLTVAEVKSGFSSAFEFSIGPVDGSAKPKAIYKAENTTYVAWSPDGKKLAVLRIADKAVPPLKRQAPQLDLVMLDGTTTLLDSNLGAQCRWFPDSRSLLIMKIVEKKEGESNFVAHLGAYDVTTKRLTPLVAVFTGQNLHFDLSPDGSKVVFTALAAGKPGTKPTAKDSADVGLFELDVKTGAVRKVRDKAKYAFYSPDGKHVLIGRPGAGFSFDEKGVLEVADANFNNPVVLAEDANQPMGMGGGQEMTYPGWIDDKHVYYFAKRHAYGKSGDSLHLITIGADGKGRKFVQPLIDAKALEYAK